jgi:hypothetical protein
MRFRLQQKTHEYRQNLHKRVREAKEKQDQTEQAIAQLKVLEEYATMVEGALDVESLAPFEYGGLAMQEALTHIPAEPGKARKKGAVVNQTCEQRVTRLLTFVSLHEEKQAVLA